MCKTKHRGIIGVATDFLLNLIAYNLIRLPKLLAMQPDTVRNPESEKIPPPRPKQAIQPRQI